LRCKFCPRGVLEEFTSIPLAALISHYKDLKEKCIALKAKCITLKEKCIAVKERGHC